MSKMQNMSDDQIRKAIETYKAKLPLIPDGEDKDLCLVGLENFQNELKRRSQKKSESQPFTNPEQLKNHLLKQAEEYKLNGHEKLADKVEKEANELPTKAEMQEWQKKAEAEIQQTHEEINNMQGDEKAEYLGKKLVTQYANMVEREQRVIEKIEGIKTVKAPAFVAPDELINVTLEDAEGQEYVRTCTKAQVRAEARRYFSNVHESWQGKEKKMKRGFKNMLAYVVAWKEFNKEMPILRDVLPEYDRYSKGGEGKEASEAFKVAQELYNKVVELLK